VILADMPVFNADCQPPLPKAVQVSVLPATSMPASSSSATDTKVPALIAVAVAPSAISSAVLVHTSIAFASTYKRCLTYFTHFVIPP
jgi:hypothetical protein